MAVKNKTITLVITGGIAAYKSLVLIRRLREAGIKVVPVMTPGSKEFVTPLSVAALAEHKVYDQLFDLTDETEMGHIRLMRDCDLVMVAPATADFLAKMATGRADDLASTALLASDKPIIVAPSMNVAMWQHAATQSNVATLKSRGIEFWGPDSGDMACGDTGSGRMVEPETLAQMAIDRLTGTKILLGKHVVVTAGPTREAIDPVRYISNHSSGKQGYAIAQAAADAGAEVTLISGPTSLPAPAGCRVVGVESAQEMLDACQHALPADAAVFCAAVADWRVANQADQKVKKSPGQDKLTLSFVKNPDILAKIASHDVRPQVVVGFAAETQSLEANAAAKLKAKNADLIIANSVASGTNTFGGEQNAVTIVSANRLDKLPMMDKSKVAQHLVNEIASRLS